jgi:hypothetical protein
MEFRIALLEQAKACVGLGSPFMGRLMTLLAHHWPDDTELAKRFSLWQGDLGPSGASLPLRLAGGLHAIVLMGKDSRLAAAYPPNDVEDYILLDAALAAIKRNDAFLCSWTESAPQTNEVRRSAVLIAITHWLDARFKLPLQVSELGASAGLNLMFDEHQWGPAQATVRLLPHWRGQLPPHSKPRVVERRGVDLHPLRIGHDEDELRLISYIWADQADRIARTRAAMALPAAEVDMGDAIEWLAKRLVSPKPGSLHFIYHTIAWQYFPSDRQARGRALIEAAGAAATEAAPLAWMSMEADGLANGAALTVRLWPGDIRLHLGRAGFHGQWVDWAANRI